MPEMLDVKDRKLIYYLYSNARMSHTQLAKRIGLSKNSIRYRIERLQKLGIIYGFPIIVNLEALGISTITILLKFNEDLYENKKILNYFVNHKYADWVAVLSGDWDLLVEFVITDIIAMEEVLGDIIKTFEEKLNTFQIAFSNTAIKVEHLVGDLYADLGLEDLPHTKKKMPPEVLDDTDKKILSALSIDSTKTYVQLKEETGISVDSLSERVPRLIKKGIISRCFVGINLKELGYVEYLAQIKLRTVTEDKIKLLKKRIYNNKNIIYAYLDTISFTLTFASAFKSTDGIDQLSRALRKEFSSIIAKEEYLLIKEHPYFNLFPRGLAE